jgi:hypothetical protein
LQNAGLDAFGQPQHVHGPEDIGLGGLDGVVLIVNRGGGTGQVVDLVHLKEDGLGDVVANHLKVAVRQEVFDILSPTGIEVVETDDLFSLIKEPLTEVRADKAGPSGNKNLMSYHL